MIKIYGMKTCPYCEYVLKQIEGNREFQYIDIGKDVRDMHAFLSLRDNNPVFDASKKEGDIGIPAFLREDGSVSLEPSDFGLHSYSEVLSHKSCSLDGKNC